MQPFVFEQGEPTKHIWYYELLPPADKKKYRKIKPIQFEEFDELKVWWNKRKENNASPICKRIAKALEANTQTEALSKNLQSNRRTKLFLNNFPTLQKIKNTARSRRQMTLQLNTNNGLRGLNDKSRRLQQAVLQELGYSAKLNICNSTIHLRGYWANFLHFPLSPARAYCNDLRCASSASRASFIYEISGKTLSQTQHICFARRLYRWPQLTLYIHTLQIRE